jgi:hypothetical protein
MFISLTVLTTAGAIAACVNAAPIAGVYTNPEGQTVVVYEPPSTDQDGVAVFPKILVQETRAEVMALLNDKKSTCTGN